MPFSQTNQLKEDENQKKTKTYIKLLYKIKNSIKPNSFILYCGFILKIIGLVLVSHIYDDNGNEINMQKHIRKITFCYNNEISCINKINYIGACIIAYILIIFPYFLFSLAYKIENNKNPKKLTLQKKILKTSSIVQLIILFLSQHIIELFSYIIFAMCIKTNETTIFLDNLGMGKFFFLVINIILIIYLNIYTFYYIAVINYPFFSQSHSIQIFQNKWFKVFIVLIFNFQSVSLVSIFSENKEYKIIIVFLLLFFLLCTYAAYYQSFFNESTFLSKLFHFCFYMCLVSCIFELYFHYGYFPNGISSNELTQKFLIEIIFAYIIMKLFKLILNRKFEKELEKILFTKQKKICVEPYLYLCTTMLKSITNNKKLEIIINIIQKHKVNCKEIACSCHKSSYTLRYENIENIIIQNKTHLTHEQFYILYKDIIIIIENEIYNMLVTISKMNKLVECCQILLLHVEYMCFFSMNIPFGCYLIEKYLKKIGKDIPFMLRFQLYQLKRHFITQYKKSLFYNSLDIDIQVKKKSHLQQNWAKELLSYWKFYKYQKIVLGIYKLLEKCVEDFLSILDLGQIKKKTILFFYGIGSSSHNTYLKDKLSFQTIVQTCRQFQKSHEKLIEDLVVNFSRDNKLMNVHVCYLLSVYFYTICKEIPFQVSKVFQNDKRHDYFSGDKFQSFSEKGFNHPIVATFEDNKTFKIQFICKYLNSLLGYEPNELIGKDINQLIPKSLWAPHQICMRNQILRKKQKFLQKEKFMIDKKGYYIPIRITFGSFPTLSKSIIIISNIEEISFPQNYTFIVLDSFGNFLTYSKTLENKFVINKEIISKNKFNFFSYFNLNENILEPFKKSLAEIENGAKKIRSLHINRISLKQLGEEGNLDSKINNVEELTFIYDKNRLRNALEKIKNWLKESQNDIVLLNKIRLQEKLFEHFQNTSNYRSNLNLLNVFKKQLLGFKMKIGSCDSTTFYYVTIFEVELESDFSFKNLNFISSNNFGNKLEDSKKIGNNNINFSYVGYSKPRPLQKELQNNSPTFSSLGRIHRWSMSQDKGQIQGSSSQINIDGFGLNSTNNLMNSNIINNSNNFNSNTPKVSPTSKSRRTSQINFSKFSTINVIKKNSQTNIKLKNSKIQTKIIYEREMSLESDDGSILRYKDIMHLINKINAYNNKKYSSLFFIMILLIVYLLISTAFYPFFIELLHKEKTFCLLSFSLRGLQYDMTLSSSLLFDGCLINTFFPEQKTASSNQRFKERLILKADSLLEDLNIFNQNMNSINIRKIDEEYNKQENFHVIKQGWHEFTKISSFLEELLYYHYFLEYLGRHQGVDNCNIHHFLYGLTNPNDDKKEIDQSEIVIYFITNNILMTVISKINSIYQIIFDENKIHFRRITMVMSLYTLCASGGFIVMTFFFYFIFNKLINNNIKLINLLISEKKDNILSFRLKSLQKMLFNFSYKTFQEYEKHLQKGASSFSERKSTGENEVYKFYSNPSLIKSKKIIKSSSSNSGLQQSIAPNPEGNIASMLSSNNNTTIDSILPSISLNNSSTLLNKKQSSKKIPQKNQKDRKNSKVNPFTETKNLTTNSTDENSTLEINYGYYLKSNLKLINLFNLSMIFFVVVTIGLLGAFSCLNVKEINKSKKLTSLGITYISKISLTILLGIIYKTTIMNFDPYQGVRYSLTDSQNTLIENWYNIEISLNSSIYSSLDESLYPIILYCLETTNENIKAFRSETGDKSPLKKVKEIWNNLDGNDFCFYSSVEYLNRHMNRFNIVNFQDFLRETQINIKECNFLGDGFLDKGLNSAIEAIINEMNVKYSEFMEDYRNNNTENVINFLTSKNMEKFNLMFDYPFDRAQMILINEIKKEFLENYIFWKKINKIFVFLFIVFDILFVFSGYFVIHKLSVFYILFHYVSNRIQEALKPD